MIKIITFYSILRYKTHIYFLYFLQKIHFGVFLSYINIRFEIFMLSELEKLLKVYKNAWNYSYLFGFQENVSYLVMQLMCEMVIILSNILINLPNCLAVQRSSMQMVLKQFRTLQTFQIYILTRRGFSKGFQIFSIFFK